MKITERDMENPAFWKLHGAAARAVEEVTGFRAVTAASDRDAKAITDAIDALTKALLLTTDSAAGAA